MNGKANVLRLFVLAAVLLTVMSLPAFARVSGWCGNNGLLRFSFVEGDSLVSVLNTGEPENGMTVFDVYAWLTDIDPVACQGEAFLHVGMVEFKLTITGAEASILEQDFPGKSLDIGKGMGHVVAALDPGERIRDGKVFIVHWKVLIQGRPENVRIGLDPTWLVSCKEGEICRDSEPQALYMGNMGSRQEGLLVGAGYVPAWINPAGVPDQTPIEGPLTWRDVGFLEER